MRSGDPFRIAARQRPRPGTSVQLGVRAHCRGGGPVVDRSRAVHNATGRVDRLGCALRRTTGRLPPMSASLQPSAVCVPAAAELLPARTRGPASARRGLYVMTRRLYAMTRRLYAMTGRLQAATARYKTAGGRVVSGGRALVWPCDGLCSVQRVVDAAEQRLRGGPRRVSPAGL